MQSLKTPSGIYLNESNTIGNTFRLMSSSGYNQVLVENQCDRESIIQCLPYMKSPIKYNIKYNKI